jgi:hypothetical protein
MDYTVEIYKLDRRCKQGQKLVAKTDFTDMTLDAVERANPRRPGYVVMIYETYVVRKNMMTGAEFRERYDTPYYCSPASESYWSM